ncbi:NADPH-dependent diflavin oxidoreductase 1, partial [Modicella reniformis]
MSHHPHETPILDFNPEPGTFVATLVQNKRITDPKHTQDVRHIDLSIKDPGFPGYYPGDVLSMRPRNLAKDVDDFLEYNGWTSIADRPLTIFQNLSVHFTKNEDEKEKLREFVSPEGQDDLYSYCHRVRRTTFEVLKDFRDVQIPLDYIMDLFPLIMPRSFSIASASLTAVQKQQQQQQQYQSGNNNGGSDSRAIHAVNGDLTTGIMDGELEWKVGLCVAIVNYKTKLWKWRTGVCTRWLKDLPSIEDVRAAAAAPSSSIEKSKTTETGLIAREPAQFSIRIQRGTLKLPKDPNVPLICIGPGTGVAPMRSFLHHRIYVQGATENVLFFGCRKRNMDYHYCEEWEQLEREGRLKVFTACSRDQ